MITHMLRGVRVTLAIVFATCLLPLAALDPTFTDERYRTGDVVLTLRELPARIRDRI